MERLLIGASTGGIDALFKLLGEFDRSCPPVVVVQNIGLSCGKGIVTLFRKKLALEVTLASEDPVLSNGRVTVIAGFDYHMRFSARNPRVLERHSAPPVNGHRPSIDVLFESAEPFAPQVGAAHLTGMGNDGAAGLLRLKRVGALTIAQDEATSRVFGMPRVANEIGAACRVLPLDRIAGALLEGAAYERTSE